MQAKGVRTKKGVLLWRPFVGLFCCFLPLGKAIFFSKQRSRYSEISEGGTAPRSKANTDFMCNLP
ncbi:MAG: hypothetical protein ACI9VN_003050 [Patescibacteria group bacterium]|jgi:hypothetical protein